jgi:hypothetical protein
MMEDILSSKPSVLARTTGRHMQEGGILRSHRRETALQPTRCSWLMGNGGSVPGH